MARSISEAILDVLAKAGASDVFGVVGDVINPFVLQTIKDPQFRWITERHEEHAGDAVAAQVSRMVEIAVQKALAERVVTRIEVVADIFGRNIASEHFTHPLVHALPAVSALKAAPEQTGSISIMMMFFHCWRQAHYRAIKCLRVGSRTGISPRRTALLPTWIHCHKSAAPTGLDHGLR